MHGQRNGGRIYNKENTRDNADFCAELCRMIENEAKKLAEVPIEVVGRLMI